jgi:S-formylglutathione hydrolase FrmB
MDVTKLANAYDVILVFPDGGQFGWYLDSPVEPKSQYESYIIKELIPYIDSHYLTIANARGRGIVGLSMGGHGAITLAFKHPDLFASASSLSGVLDLTRHSNDFELPKRLGSIRTNRAAWEANSALHLARQLTPDFPVKLFVDVGTSDFTLAANRAFAKEVTGRGVPLKYVERPGTHDWAYWTGNIAEHIAFHAAAFPAVQ